jgi:hypothetical protein
MFPSTLPGVATERGVVRRLVGKSERRRRWRSEMSDIKLSREERKRQIMEELWPTKPPPKPGMAAPISDRMVAAVRANPADVRMVAKEETGAVLVERLVTVRTDLVWEVDENARPVWPKAGVVHEYNPLDALRRD